MQPGNDNDCIVKKLFNVREFEEEAKKRIQKNTWEFYRSGANYELSLLESEAAFDRLRIRPRFFRQDLSDRDLGTQIFGHEIRFPIGVSPTAMQRMAHPMGEVATAKACEAMKTIYIMSTFSTSSIEEIASAAPGATKWFQLWICKNRKLSVNLAHRAEESGFRAIVISVDIPVLGQRYCDMKNKFALPENLQLANIPPDSAQISPEKNSYGSINYVIEQFDASVTWKDFEWFQKQTKLPVIAKGILTVEDALLAVAHGASGIIVSNHGARQLDSVPASIEVLPEIVKAVGNKCQVFLDGGIRSGVDILKALALGARMVFVGRPIIWGLACGGENGVKKVMQIFRDELDVAMALSGAARLEDLNSSMVCKADSFWSKL